MSISAPPPKHIRQNKRGLQLFAITGGLLTLLFVLGGVAAAAAPAKNLPAPVKQATQPGNTNETGEQRSIRVYLESKGYEVDTVGFPTDSHNEPVDGYVAVSMALASQSFDPNTGLDQDQDTITQVLYGFNALHHYYPDYTNLVVVLNWQDYVLWFPISADTFQSYLDRNTSPDDMWAEVMDNFIAYDSTTGEQYGAKDFANKDFSGGGNTTDPSTPPVDPNSGVNTGSTDNPTGPLRVRLQPSSAYLPADGQPIRLIATVNDASNRRVSNRNVDFSASSTGQDAQDLGAAKTGADGVARTDLKTDQELGTVSITAKPDTSDIQNQSDQVGSAATLVVGPVLNSDDDRASAISQGLQAYGYETGETGSQDEESSGGETSTFGYAVERIASSQFDDTVRTQILTTFGTIFRVYPNSVASARTALVYSNNKTNYMLIYSLVRDDWQSFVDGKSDEGQLWQAMSLNVINADTNQPVDEKSFGDKNFAGGTTEDLIQRTITTQLVHESWGDQLYSAQISVPLGATADTFKVGQKSGNGVFDIYDASNPTTPLYSSAQDANGAKLASLSLTQGEYMLTIASGDPPTSVQMTYTEHTER